ncbi:MAG: GntR family transcriptional regulator [Deltaproteobacteria bacterium]|nr:GntR family transcriptional regulator [Deltaproteobacteria bacterium]
MPKSLREKIYEKVRDDITYGKFAPGERLVEDRLAEEFKASRSPIREALRQLESEGLITFERNKGITIARLSIKQVDEIYTLRWLLESYAARLTAERFAKKDVPYLRDLQEKLRVAAKNMDLRDWLHNNTLFHNFLSEHCGNSNLIQVLGNLKRRVYRYHYITVSVPGHFETYLGHHEGMLQGCEKNDGEMAEKFMKLHLQTIKDVLINHLKEVTPNY